VRPLLPVHVRATAKGVSMLHKPFSCSLIDAAEGAGGASEWRMAPNESTAFPTDAHRFPTSQSH
jgi:hypothetical protein